MRYIFQILLCLLLCNICIENTYGNELAKTPFLRNHTKAIYNAGAQNWQIIQTANDVMYFANNSGILRYDGFTWQLKEVTNKSVVRSICEIGTDSILVGAYGEFGLIFTNNYGEMEFQSWMNKIPVEYQSFHEVWKIYKLGNRLFVHTFSHLIVFNNNKFEVCFQPQKSYMFAYMVNDKLYVQDFGYGVCTYENGELLKIPELDIFNNKEIWAILPFDPDRLLIGTQLNGVYIFNGESSIPWKSEATDFLEKNNLFCGIQMNNGNYVFGTIQNGLIIANNAGNIISVQNSAVGLQNNTALCLFEDNTYNLWVGLDNGIDFIQTNSSLYHVRKKGGFGMGYTASIYDKKLYVGTNQGMYYIPYDESIKSDIETIDFKSIEEIKGQVWTIKTINNTLFCCHNFGLYFIRGNQLKKVESIVGAWDVQEIPSNPKYYLVGTYQGFYLLDKKTFKATKIEGFNESSRRYIFDSNNNIIVSHGYKGIYNLSIDYENTNATLINYYNANNGLPNNYGNEVFKIKDRLVVTSDSGFFNIKDGKLEYNEVMNQFFPDDPSNITTLLESDNSRFFCFKNGDLYHVTWLNNNMFDIKSQVFAPISRTFPKSFESILTLKNNKYLIGNEEGFILYLEDHNNNNSDQIKLDIASANYIDKASGEPDKLHFKRTNTGVDLGSIPYKYNNLVFTLSMPYYSRPDALQFRYRLNNGPWSKWFTGNYLWHNNFREGEYFIDVECSIDRDKIAGKTSIRINIDPPLYRQWYSYLFYLAFFFATTLLASSLIKKKISYEKRKESIIQQKKMIENRIQLKRKAELAQTELINFRNEKLKTDIRHKSKELANTTMSIIQKNQMLQQIKDVLIKIGKDDIKYRENKDISRLVKRIDKEIEHQDNWTVFEKNFDKVHENFLQRLKETHKDLTPKDLRLAAYLRMNLSSKEIAPLLNISIRSVEISRYRLRKKMDLPHDQNLTEYIIST